MPPDPFISTDEHARMVWRYNDDGWTIEQIAAEMRRKPGTVRLQLRVAGIWLPPEPGDVDVNAVVASYKRDRLTMREVATKHQIPYHSVRNILTGAGVLPTPGRSRTPTSATAPP